MICGFSRIRIVRSIGWGSPGRGGSSQRPSWDRSAAISPLACGEKQLNSINKSSHPFRSPALLTGSTSLRIDLRDDYVTPLSRNMQGPSHAKVVSERKRPSKKLGLFAKRLLSGDAGRSSGFTLLELLVSMALVVIVAGLSFSIMAAITSAWRAHKTRVGAFGDARVVFETLTNRLSQATLNTYWDYDNRGAPTRYLRKSELHFVQGQASSLIPNLSNAVGQCVFFCAPLGVNESETSRPLFKMLSACGFYVRFGVDRNRPLFVDQRLAHRYRFRLYQFLEPGERLRIYEAGVQGTWYSDDLADWSFPMAENVIGLILRVRYPDGSGNTETYNYNSRDGVGSNSPPITMHQLPPVISVTLVVIDENTALRLADKYGDAMPPILPPTNAFTSDGRYEDDLSEWEDKLKLFTTKIDYRILTAEVYLRGTKWSSQ